MNAIFRSGFLVVTIMLALAVPADAGPYEDGVAASGRGDYATALRIFRSLADTGDAKGQNGLGVLYNKGQGVPQDYTEAAKWYRKAAEQGSARAQVNLGVLYQYGRGVPQDDAAAHMWFSLAIAQSDEKAQTARDDLVKRMTHGQIEEATLLVREWRAEHQQ